MQHIEAETKLRLESLFEALNILMERRFRMAEGRELSIGEIQFHAGVYFQKLADRWLDKMPYKGSPEIIMEIQADLGADFMSAASIIRTIRDECPGELIGMYYVFLKDTNQFYLSAKAENRLINGKLDSMLN